VYREKWGSVPDGHYTLIVTQLLSALYTLAAPISQHDSFIPLTVLPAQVLWKARITLLILRSIRHLAEILVRLRSPCPDLCYQSAILLIQHEFHTMHLTHIVKRRSIIPHFKQENPVEQYPVYQSPLYNLRCLGPRRPRILQLHPPPIRLLVVELVLRMQVLEVGRPFFAGSVRVVGCGKRCRDVVGGHFWLDAENCFDGRPNRGPAILDANLGRRATFRKDTILLCLCDRSEFRDSGCIG
jgi:hypothetical protein